LVNAPPQITINGSRVEVGSLNKVKSNVVLSREMSIGSLTTSRFYTRKIGQRAYIVIIHRGKVAGKLRVSYIASAMHSSINTHYHFIKIIGGNYVFPIICSVV